MPDSEISIKNLFLEDAPLGFVKGIVERAVDVYGDAHARSFNESAWEKPEGYYIFGHNRRILFEAMLRKEAIKNGLPATVEYTTPTKTPYTLVRVGRFLLTQSHVQCRGELPPAADFREQHAAVNALLMKGRLPFVEFDPLKLYELTQANSIYGVITHGSPYDDAKSPAYMSLVIPAKDLSKIVDRVDLFELRKEMLAKAQAVAQTEIAVDLAKPTIKRKADK